MAKRSSARKRVTNPLMRKTGANKSRPRLSFNGQVIESVTHVDASITASNIGGDFHTVDCNNAAGINRGAASITSLYQDYKYLQASVEFLPFFGPSSPEAPGRIYIAYMDNPEMMVVWKTASPANKVAFVKGLPGVKIYNIWERFTYRVPLTYRRKWWNVNVNQVTPGAEETERSSQGMVVIAIESISAAVTVGRWLLRGRTQLQGLTQAQST